MVPPRPLRPQKEGGGSRGELCFRDGYAAVGDARRERGNPLELPRLTSLQNTVLLPTFANFEVDLRFVADQHGYERVVHHVANQFLKIDKNTSIVDPCLFLNKFQATYGKPLLAVKDSKCSAKDTEAGVLAMEALHKQVMPFLLRRTKDEVLSDLPEKIIQDRYCDLSSIQLKLYEQFSGSNTKKEISTLVKEHDSANTEMEAKPLEATPLIF